MGCGASVDAPVNPTLAEKSLKDEPSQAQSSSAPTPSVKRQGSRLVRTDTIKNVRPPSVIGTSHPAAWMIKDPNYSICLDDNGNTYYYNSETGESSWFPPTHFEESLGLPPHQLTFHVTVPDGVAPGESFTVKLGDALVEVLCPLDCASGEDLELFYAESQETAEAVAGEGDEGGYTAELIQETSAVQVEEEKEVEPLVAWGKMAEVADIDIYVIETDVVAAKNVLTDVSQGVYFDDLIYQLSWAYRMSQLEGAIRDCFKRNGDWFDSSPYDNCDGVPRYENSGLVEWWEDLRIQRLVLEDNLKSTAGHKRFFNDELFVHSTSTTAPSSTAGVTASASESSKVSLSESLAIDINSISEDDANLLTTLIQRKNEVVTQLENVTARVLAIVSVEGGPTKESIQTVHDCLKESLMTAPAENNSGTLDAALNNNANGGVDANASDNINEEDLAEHSPIDQDEIDEVVANAIQPRHRFVVDILLSMTLLENELESLEAQINRFVSKSSGNNNNNNNSNNNNENKETSAEGDPNSADSGKSEAEIAMAALVAEQAKEMQRLQEELAFKRSEQSKALKERLQKRHDARMAELQSSGNLSEEEASLIVTSELLEESAQDAAKMGEDAARAVSELRLTQLADLKKKGMEEEQRLADALEGERNRKLAAMHARLEARRLKAESDFESRMNNSASQPEKEEAFNALDRELKDLDEEEEKETAEINLQTADAAKTQRAAILECIKGQHEAELSRLEEENAAQQEMRKRALKARLDKKLQKRASEVMESSNGNLTMVESLAIAEAEISKEEAEGNSAIDNDLKAKKAKAEESVLQSLHETNNRELEKLEADMQNKEALQKKSLEDRLNKRRAAGEKSIALFETTSASSSDSDASTSSFTASMKEKIEKELAAEEAEAKQQLATSLSNLKTEYEAEAEKMKDILEHKKASANAKLNSRLEAKKKKQEEEKLRAKQQEEEGGIIAEDFITNLRKDQKLQLKRLSLLIQLEKNKTLEKNRLSQAGQWGSGGGGGGGGMEDDESILATKQRAKVLMQFGILSEYMVTGFKKNALYQVKEIKNLIENRGETLKTGKLTKGDLKSLESSNYSCEEASLQLLTRFQRDIKGVIDAQYVERQNNIAKMQESGASKTRIAEAEMKYDDLCQEALGSEFTKAMCTLSGIFINKKLLLEGGGKAGDSSTSGNGGEMEDSDDEEGENGVEGGRNTSISFDQNMLEWISGVVGLMTAYSETLSPLFTCLAEAHGSVVVGTKDDAIFDMSRLIRSDLLRTIMTPVLINAFQKNFSQKHLLPSFENFKNLATVASGASGTARGDANKVLGSAIKSSLDDNAIDIDTAFASKKASFANNPSASNEFENLITTSYRGAIAKFSDAPLLSHQDIVVVNRRSTEMLRKASLEFKSKSSRSLSTKFIDTQQQQQQQQSEQQQKQKPGNSSMLQEAREREAELVKSLEAKMEKKRRDLTERLKKKKEVAALMAATSAGAEDTPPNKLDDPTDAQDFERWKAYTKAFEDVKQLVASNTSSVSLDAVSADGLMLALEKRLEGQAVDPQDLVVLQKEAEVNASKEQAQRVLRQQMESAEKLNIALQIKQAKNQQRLQQRLNKKKEQGLAKS